MAGTPADSTPCAAVLVESDGNLCGPATFTYEVFGISARITLRVADMAGRPLALLADELMRPRVLTATWDGRDSTGTVRPGRYLIQLIVKPVRGTSATRSLSDTVSTYFAIESGAGSNR